MLGQFVDIGTIAKVMLIKETSIDQFRTVLQNREKADISLMLFKPILLLHGTDGVNISLVLIEVD